MKVDDDAEDVVSTMKKYDVVVLPVVTEDGRLTGRITFDDVMDVMEEAEEGLPDGLGISGSRGLRRQRCCASHAPDCPGC